MSDMYTKLKKARLWMSLFSLPLLILSASSQLQASDSIEGNIENGKTLADRKCDRCHGSGGVSDDPDTPHLAAQSAAYLLKQMRDYKSRSRDDRNMYKRAR